MLIGVISDTHRYNHMFEKIIDKVKNTDLLIHLGDNSEDMRLISKYYNGSIISVRGNCDFSMDSPLEVVKEIEGYRFFITHGHRYNVKFGMLNLMLRAKELEADVVLFGHTHSSQVSYEEGIWFVNPGSCALSRDGLNSFAMIDITEGKINPSIVSL